VTAPRWISEAIEASGEMLGPSNDEIAKQLIERLPLEAMRRAALDALDEVAANHPAEQHSVIALTAIVGVLTDGDPEVVELAELYQGACRALDAAGVPYAVDVEPPQHLAIESASGEMTLHKVVQVHEVPAHPASQRLDLAGRIRWLAQQRPIRLELESAQATCKLAEELATKYMIERGAADERASAVGELYEESEAQQQQNRDDKQHLRNEIADQASYITQLESERDLARTMHQDAEHAFAAAMTERDAARADLDRERREHEDAENAGNNRELELRQERDAARELADRLPVQMLQQDRKIADQAAYIEQLEVEIDALEDEIWQDGP
jgi:hypothetical protein